MSAHDGRPLDAAAVGVDEAGHAKADGGQVVSTEAGGPERRVEHVGGFGEDVGGRMTRMGAGRAGLTDPVAGKVDDHRGMAGRGQFDAGDKAGPGPHAERHGGRPRPLSASRCGEPVSRIRPVSISSDVIAVTEPGLMPTLPGHIDARDRAGRTDCLEDLLAQRLDRTGQGRRQRAASGRCEIWQIPAQKDVNGHFLQAPT
ncbi:MAG: hypothetical protein ACN6I5_00105 [Hyphomicrobiales bacterium]